MQILVYEFVCEKSNPNKNIVCESKAVLDWKKKFWENDRYWSRTGENWDSFTLPGALSNWNSLSWMGPVRCPVRNGPLKPEDNLLLRNFWICSAVRIRCQFPSSLNLVWWWPKHLSGQVWIFVPVRVTMLVRNIKENIDSWRVGFQNMFKKEHYFSTWLQSYYLLNIGYLTPKIVGIKNVLQAFLLPIQSIAFFDKVVHCFHIFFLSR